MSEGLREGRGEGDCLFRWREKKCGGVEMKRQRSYDAAIVKVESSSREQEAGGISGKEVRHESARVKRRDGGSGHHHGRSTSEREGSKGEEHRPHHHARRRDGGSSGHHAQGSRSERASEPVDDGEQHQQQQAGNKEESTTVRSSSRGTNKEPLGAEKGSSMQQHYHSRSGKAGAFARREPAKDEEGGGGSSSKGIEGDRERRKSRKEVKAEQEAGVNKTTVAESEKSSDMEEGELEPEAGGDDHEEARREVEEAEEAKVDQISKEDSGGKEVVGDVKAGERGEAEEEQEGGDAMVNMAVDGDVEETVKQVIETSVKQGAGAGADAVVQEVVREPPQWGLKLGAAEKGVETQEIHEREEDASQERGRRAGREREFGISASGEESPLEEEMKNAGKNLMGSSGSGRERQREAEEEEEERQDSREQDRPNEKKQRVENNGALLSLALPDTSLSLSSGDPRSRSQKHHQHRSHSHPSQGGAHTHSRGGFSESLSLSQSLPFHHNPSCSLTQTSLDKTEMSSGSQQISVAKEQGSYGSWPISFGSSQGNEGMMASMAHDKRKPKPLYQRVLSGNNPQIVQGSLGDERSRGQGGKDRGSESLDNSHGSHQVPMADGGMLGQSSEARRAMRKELQHRMRHGETGEVWSSPSRSGSSRETQPRDMPSKGEKNFAGQREKEAAGSERQFTSIGVEDIVAEPVPSMARKLQELPDSFLAGLKESLKEMLNSIDKREQFMQLQQRLTARTDLTTDVLLRAHRTQLEILVAVKTGILAFLQNDIPMIHTSLVEVFLQQRCRNFGCQNQLPADECDCKLCAQKSGFCNSCMCVVCSKFDFDANTCRWIGCDFCLHWCHTDCGIRMSYITPGPSLTGAEGTTEMQFHCIACTHTSELYGFVKDVFCTCAAEWGKDVLAAELDCVQRIFHGSADTRGQQLCNKAEQVLQQLNSQVDAAIACRAMIKFFNGEL